MWARENGCVRDFDTMYTHTLARCHIICTQNLVWEKEWVRSCKERKKCGGKSQSLTNQIIQATEAPKESQKYIHIHIQLIHSQHATASRIHIHAMKFEKKTLSVVTAVISFYKWNTFYGRMREKEWDSKENRRKASEKEMKQWSVEICRFVFTCHRSWEKPAVGGYPPK